MFLTADAAERARRRAAETGEDVGIEEAALRRRDRIDTNREASPLRAAADAYLLDTTGMKPDEVVAAIVTRLSSVEEGEGG